MSALDKVTRLINYVSDGKIEDEENNSFDDLNDRFEVGYWKIRGLGEGARLMFAYRNISFIDTTYEQGDSDSSYDRSKWFNVKFNLGLDFPNLPYLIDKKYNLKLTESRAIYRYIARCLNIGSHTDPEQAIQEMIADIVSDAASQFASICYKYAGKKMKGEEYSSLFESEKELYINKKLPQLLEPLEKFLTSRNRLFLGGNQPCYADFQFWQFLDSNLNLDSNSLNNYPNLQKCEKAFVSIPNIEKFLKEHPASNYPMNNKIACFGHTDKHNTRELRNTSQKTA